MSAGPRTKERDATTAAAHTASVDGVAREARRRVPQVMRSLRPFVAPFLLVLGAAVFFARPLFEGGAFEAIDFVKIQIPFRTFIADALATHQLPLWNPRLLTGVPRSEEHT